MLFLEALFNWQPVVYTQHYSGVALFQYSGILFVILTLVKRWIMWKKILKFIKASVPKKASLVAACISVCSLYGQQNIIADKDNTRPEISREQTRQAGVFSFSAKKYNGYNEVQWSAMPETDIRKYIVEYSPDGINFQSAGETPATNGLNANGNYLLKHYTQDIRPLLYRLRMESLNGKYQYSPGILLDGIDVPPVKIYPTIISGNNINIIADFPVERISIFSSAGQQLFSRDMNGVKDFTSVPIPSLSNGMYWMAFYGSGWKSTAKFVIQ